MKLYINSDNSEGETFNKRDYLLLAAKRLGFDEKHLNECKYDNPNAISIARWDSKVSADYVLNIEPFSFLQKGSIWTGVWEIDVMFDREQMKVDNWIASNMVFIANTFVPNRMNVYGGPKVFMFQACDPIIHKRVPSVKQEFDFVFCGSAGLDIYRKREEAMTLMRKYFSFRDFPKGQPPHKYIECLSAARVQFIRSAIKENIGDSQVEQRFFECLALGPVLKDYHPALETLGLIEGEDFYWYKDDKEMLEKMHYLIDNPEFAKQMAENGRRKALLYHTYDNRLMSILNYMQEK